MLAVTVNQEKPAQLLKMTSTAYSSNRSVASL